MSEKGPGKQGSSKSKAKKSLPGKQDAAESPCKSKTKGKGSSKAKPKATNKTLDEPYDSYLSEGVVSDGLKRGTFIKGTLRINPKKYQDAFVPDPEGGSDIYLPGLTMRNRALNGDVVVIDLLHRSQWKRKELEGEDDVTDGEKRFVTQKTGKVVFILEKKHSRATTGFLKAYDKLDKTAIFSPVDHRLPRLLVPLADCPKEYLKTPSQFEKTLFVAKIEDWPLDCPFAHGRLARSLGEAGEIEPETEGFLLENGVDFSVFSKEVLDCLPKDLPWKIPKEEMDKRLDLRNECIFTIDPSTARDLDDALHCKQLPDGIFEVGVHIADVSHFVKPETALNEVALARATSVYLVQRVIPMLPRLLCEELCSLNPNEERLAFSVIWKLSPTGEILSEWVGKTVIRSCVKMAYGDAQLIIENPTKSWELGELPAISDGHTVASVAQSVLNLNKIAVSLRQARLDEGALRLDQPKVTLSLNTETGMPNGCVIYEQKDSNKLIEEFMLLANISVAKRIYRAFPDRALLRHHPKPDAKLLDDVAKISSCQEIMLDITNSKTLQASLQGHRDKEKEPGETLLLTSLLARPMKLAQYFCTTGLPEDEDKNWHYALSIPVYTHFTSPIRRYPDVMVHRLLAASLGIDSDVREGPDRMHAIASHCNDKRSASKRVQELSTELFFSIFIRECGPLAEKGMISGVLDKAVDVLVLRLGITVRIYCEQMPLEYEHSKTGHKSVLSLRWKTDGEEPVIQCLAIFAPVQVIIKAKEDGLKYSAFLERPSSSKNKD